MSTLLLVDGNGLACRGAFSGAEQLATRTGIPTKATHLFFRTLYNVLHRVHATHLCVAWDTPIPPWRRELYAAYKAQRVSGHGVLAQEFTNINRILNDVGIVTATCEGYEGDDVIATLLQRSAAQRNYLLTGDRDLFQLVGPRTQALYLADKLAAVDPAYVLERYGVTVAQYVDYKTLVGDSADNLPGCEGCGAVKAAQLLQRYGDVPTLLTHTHELTPALRLHVEAWAPSYPLMRRLVTLVREVPVPHTFADCTYQPVWERALRGLHALELHRLTEDIERGRWYGQDTATDA